GQGTRGDTGHGLILTGRPRSSNLTPVNQPRPVLVLTVDCPDGPGLIHAVSGFLFHRSGNILESQQFEDHLTGRFFQRIEFEVFDEAWTTERLSEEFAEVAATYGMNWQLRSATEPYRTVIMVSKDGHCL